MKTIEKKVAAYRIEIAHRNDFPNPAAKKILEDIQTHLKFQATDVKIVKVYTLYKALTSEQYQTIADELLQDPVVEEVAKTSQCDWWIEIGLKPSMTDNVGKTAQLVIEDYLKEPFQKGERVHFSRKYLLTGPLEEEQVLKIAKEFLANPLIEEIAYGKEEDGITLPKSDAALLSLSQQKGYALNLEEMRAIDQFFKEQGRNPTDVEMEILAQTWSEHCKHKIFNATIYYEEDGREKVIHSLFNTYIKKATKENDRPFLVSVFTDNAGIVNWNENYHIAVKVETHNSPSSLDPYGGALTGILGVNRDILGAGMGARVIANTNVFCFAPEKTTDIPHSLLPPKRIFDGVRLGVEHGGNKSGVPTVNGAIVYDKSFLAKPLVFCGSIGILPSKIHGKNSHEKEILPGDSIVIVGGRTGKDGIHGATFSSLVLNDKSPVSAVQIGDPFTQKKVHDFLLEARDQGFYRTVTDNGAGGFSSSVGELAVLSNGCEIHLDCALLKAMDLMPWEIMVSESQERMTFAVPKDFLEAFISLAQFHEVEAFVLGTFTDTGELVAYYREKICAKLPLTFLHSGNPTLKLEAKWQTPKESKSALPNVSIKEALHAVLASGNVCSKERVIRQYDHEVQGGSVIKPLVGKDGPADAAVIKPIETHYEPQGLVIANGICPKFSQLDTYHMAANAVDEAIRNCVAVGCDLSTISLLDNFCWPDPIDDPVHTPDGKFKLAQLIRANQALYDSIKVFQTPLISGKDSMKNDYKSQGVSLSVEPTLLMTAVGKIPAIEKAVTSDFKFPGDLIYVVGQTRPELGRSEFALIYGVDGLVPKVDFASAKKMYEKIFDAMQHSIIASCHDCSDGGIAVALTESAIGGNLGVEVDCDKIPQEGCTSKAEILFSETPSRFIVSIASLNKHLFEEMMEGVVFAEIGKVKKELKLTIHPAIEETIEDLKDSWRKDV